ncbi:hypothetical protein NQ314_020663 [Rhamnusium bicolor]|uniref:receptor protein-tyrosine kinase n=1 Tax=Rhamnusium bicolor TaxID=1586634 RepID=A0AAV8WJ45_9CUCU|nr:hypothetical protein NQ314_020663 [Rhamnusium bicolor]
MKECPPDYYKYLDRRCLKRDKCISMPKPIELHATNEIAFPYKIFNGSCILHCPADYKSDYLNHTCIQCGGRCEKYCDGINIDSISLAKQLRGCTHIKGSLEIQIRGGSNVVNELEENLSMIEEISGYLKIVRSFSLVSLNFLKNLKRIRGDSLENQKYVFVVLDNQNLQELWDQENKTLKIDSGRLFFSLQSKIVKSVTLEWKQFKMDDQRKLLGYIVYCIEAPHKNITMYDGRDACGQDNWRVYDVPYQEGELTVFQLLPNLKPYTQYAFYVKTYTIASERTGAQSRIKYFRTKPSMPSSPQNLQVVSNSSDSLIISWLPPANPNGNITHYIISCKKHSNGDNDSEDRNYCLDPPTTKPVPPQISQPTPPPKNDTCSCEDNPHSGKPLSINELEEAARIKFEDELHNQVYVKRYDLHGLIKTKPMNLNIYRPGSQIFRDQRTKRDTIGEPFPNRADNHSLIINNKIQNVTENGTNIWISFSRPVYGHTEFFTDRLHHFTFYDINVQACREKEDDKDNESTCSSTSMQTKRTQKKRNKSLQQQTVILGGADHIREVHITNRTLDSITITWDQPKDPNGIIFAITVEYKRVDIENAKPISLCITSKDFKNDSSYSITKLFSGNYSLRVMATTSAGEGEYSPYVHFYINEPTSNTIVIVSVTIIVFLGVLLCLVWLYRKHQKERENLRLFPSVNPEYIPSVYIPDDWEGSFGMVWEGLAHDIKGKPEIRCAVKTVNEHATNSQDDQTTPLRKVSDKLGGYTPSESQDSDELDIDTHHQFPSISESGVVTTTANGYVSGCPTNGAATTQC